MLKNGMAGRLDQRLQGYLMFFLVLSLGLGLQGVNAIANERNDTTSNSNSTLTIPTEKVNQSDVNITTAVAVTPVIPTPNESLEMTSTATIPPSPTATVQCEISSKLKVQWEGNVPYLMIALMIPGLNDSVNSSEKGNPYECYLDEERWAKVSFRKGVHPFVNSGDGQPKNDSLISIPLASNQNQTTESVPSTTTIKPANKPTTAITTKFNSTSQTALSAPQRPGSSGEESHIKSARNAVVVLIILIVLLVCASGLYVNCSQGGWNRFTTQCALTQSNFRGWWSNRRARSWYQSRNDSEQSGSGGLLEARPYDLL